jgi:hypothetical protein
MELDNIAVEVAADINEHVQDPYQEPLIPSTPRYALLKLSFHKVGS